MVDIEILFPDDFLFIWLDMTVCDYTRTRAN